MSVALCFFFLFPVNNIEASELNKQDIEKNEFLDDVLSGFDDAEEGENLCEDADCTDELEDVLEGFDEDGDTGYDDKSPDDSAEVNNAQAPPISIDFSGFFSTAASINFAHNAPAPGETDHRGLRKLRSSLQLEMETKFLKYDLETFVSGNLFHDFAYSIEGRDEFTGDVLNEYENEAEFREVFVLWTPYRAMDLKVGRQIVVWGKADYMRVLDVLNPLDNREPGLVDIEGLRMPLTMVKIDLYKESWNLSTIIIPEIRFNKDPEYGNDFYPSPFLPLYEHTPSDWSVDNSEIALALKGYFRGWDISFLWAYFYDDQPHLEQLSPAKAELYHSRLHMAGIGLNMALGSWLLKSELAFFRGMEFYSLPGAKKERLDFLLGFEYSGFTDILITLEAVNRHMFNYKDILDTDINNRTIEDDFQLSLMYKHDFLHDTLHLYLLSQIFGIRGENGAFERISLEYNLNDNTLLKGGLLLYHNGDSYFFKDIDDNDRLFFEVKYSF